MAKLELQKAKDAARVVQKYAKEVRDGQAFMSDVIKLIRAVQDDTELALMRGEVRPLGEKHMLLSKLRSAVSLTTPAVHREAAITAITEALDQYLGIPFKKKRKKKKRRGLLPRV